MLREEHRGGVTFLTLSRPPHNFFDSVLLAQLADAVGRCDNTPSIRAIVLSSDQRSFCAGADFGGGKRPDPAMIYNEAVRLAGRRKPMVAAIKGAAIGGGLGLALAADFRIGCTETRLQANFTRIGISPGFGLTFTLPRIIGRQAALDLFLTARRIEGEEAYRLGMLDRLVLQEDVETHAEALAYELASNAPSAMLATRALALDDYPSAFRAAVARELGYQEPLFANPDFDEGVRAAAERRLPAFADPIVESQAAAGVTPSSRIGAEH